VAWHNDTSSWHSLADVKKLYPIQLAEYAIKHELQNEPSGFAWWVKPVLKRKKSLNKAMKTRYAKRSHKFSIQVPAMVKEALEIDKARLQVDQMPHDI
jgi:hypothetical protein